MAMQLMETVEHLFTKMDELVPAALYPPHVLPIPERIGGTRFFPGGSGVYLEGRDPNTVEFPFGGVMVLGHNFDSEAAYQDSLRRRTQPAEPALVEGVLSPSIGHFERVRAVVSQKLGRRFLTSVHPGRGDASGRLPFSGIGMWFWPARPCKRFQRAPPATLGGPHPVDIFTDTRADINRTEPKTCGKLGLPESAGPSMFVRSIQASRS